MARVDGNSKNCKISKKSNSFVPSLIKLKLKKFWKKFGHVCFHLISVVFRRFRISLMKIWKREGARTPYYFSRYLSLFQRSGDSFPRHATPRCVMWLNILNLRRNNFLTIKFTPKLIVTLSTGHVPANERTSREFIMFSSRDLTRVESRKHSATISKVKSDILK